MYVRTFFLIFVHDMHTICKRILYYTQILLQEFLKAGKREQLFAGYILQGIASVDATVNNNRQTPLTMALRGFPVVCWMMLFCTAPLQAQSVGSARLSLPDTMTAQRFPTPRTKHTFRSDVSWVGLPWIVAGFLLRNDKANFREVRNKFLYNFHHTADNYSQYVPLAVTTGLKLAGYEGRSRWDRYGVSAGASYAIMAALVNGVKYSMKELRPDGSTRNSFPSGHTATAFVAATILHKEYGMTRSPWISIAGYALATATGCMRVLNNRHWISDTFAGAGIGILSTELGYAIGDLLFKDKGLQRPDIERPNNLYRYPSFFNVHLGVGLGAQSLDLIAGNPDLADFYEGYSVRNLKFSRATVVGAEGAYFFNPYFGIGGRLRVNSRLVKNWSDFAQSPIGDLSQLDPYLESFINKYELNVKSDRLSEFSLSAGAYFSLPLTPRLALGTKLLVGRNYTQGIDINAHVEGQKRDVDMSYDEEDGRRFLVYEIKGENSPEGEKYETDWDYLSVKAGRSMEVGTGVSLTYAYKSRMAFRLFLDYDFTRKRYEIDYAPMLFMKAAARNLTFNGRPANADDYITSYTMHTTKSMSKFVLGGAFCVTF